MRRINSFILGLLCGSLIFGTARVLANTDVLARLTTQLFFWNDEKIELEAYNINGYNYVRLRDVSNIFGVNIEYDEETRSVYLGETKTERIIDGNSYAREDYSQKANSNVFPCLLKPWHVLLMYLSPLPTRQRLPKRVMWAKI